MDHTFPAVVLASAKLRAGEMKKYIYSKNTVVLLFLVILTLLSWYVGLSGGESLKSDADSVVMIFLSFLKTGLVILFFMEVKSSKPELLGMCGVWVVGSCVLTSSVLLSYI